ncbi:MAG: hypothetical protein H6639_00840 [Caldilineaceae bacterium]|nr:hypothetical protein [Caldilineaceae bacterium]
MLARNAAGFVARFGRLPDAAEFEATRRAWISAAVTWLGKGKLALNDGGDRGVLLDLTPVGGQRRASLSLSSTAFDPPASLSLQSRSGADMATTSDALSHRVAVSPEPSSAAAQALALAGAGLARSAAIRRCGDRSGEQSATATPRRPTLRASRLPREGL